MKLTTKFMGATILLASSLCLALPPSTPTMVDSLLSSGKLENLLDNVGNYSSIKLSRLVNFRADKKVMKLCFNGPAASKSAGVLELAVNKRTQALPRYEYYYFATSGGRRIHVSLCK